MHPAARLISKGRAALTHPASACLLYTSHGGGNGLVAGKGTELVYLVFQQKGILAAALQQGCGSALGQDVYKRQILICPPGLTARRALESR